MQVEDSFLNQFLHFPQTIQVDKETFVVKISFEINLFIKNLSVLSSRREYEAVTDLEYFLKFLLNLNSNSHDLKTVLVSNSQFLKLILEEFVVGVCNEILKGITYSNKRVLELIASIFEEIVNFCSCNFVSLKRNSFLLINLILNKQNLFFIENQEAFDFENAPFGEEIKPSISSLLLIEKLKKGDQFDILKHSRDQTVWSRAIFEKIENKKVFFRFSFDENLMQQEIIGAFVAPVGQKSKDFEWRGSLEKGNELDYYDFRTRWSKARVTNTVFKMNKWSENVLFLQLEKSFDEDEDMEKEIEEKNDIKSSYVVNEWTLKKRQSMEQRNETVTISAFSPIIAQPKTHSLKRHFFIDDSFDSYWLSLIEKNKIAIRRPTLQSASKSSVFVRYFNLLNENGLFEFAVKVANHEIQTDKETLIDLCRVFINCSEILTEEWIASNGKSVLDFMHETMNNTIVENIRMFSNNQISTVLDSIECLSLRVFPQKKVQTSLVSLKMKISICVLKSGMLEKQILGTKIIQDLSEVGFVCSDYDTMRKIADELLNEGALEIVIKGHSSLIERSASILRIMLSLKKIDEPKIDFIFEILNKVDRGTRNALIFLLDSTKRFFDVCSIKHFVKNCFLSKDVLDKDLFELAISMSEQIQDTSNANEIKLMIFDGIWDLLQTNESLKSDFRKTITNYLKENLSKLGSQKRKESIYSNYSSNVNKKLNLKLLKTVSFSLTSNLDNFEFSHMIMIYKVVEVTVLDLIQKIKEIKMTETLCSEGADKISKLNTKEDSFGKEIQTKISEKNILLKKLEKDIKKIIDFLKRIVFVDQKASSKMFRFCHFEDIFSNLIKDNIFNKLIDEFLFKFLEGSNVLQYIENFKEFFFCEIQKCPQNINPEFVKYFGELFIRINELEGKYVLNLKNQKSEKTKFNKTFVCSVHVEQFFGISLLNKWYESVSNTKAFRYIGNLMANIYLPPFDFPLENNRIYPRQIEELRLKAVQMFKKGEILSAKKASILLLKIIKFESMKTTKGIPSLDELNEGRLIELFIDSRVNSQKRMFNFYLSTNQTVHSLKKELSKELELHSDFFTISDSNNIEIKNEEQIRTVDSIGDKSFKFIYVLKSEKTCLEINQLFSQDSGEITRKAKLILEEIFDDFSIKGVMGLEEFAKFMFAVHKKKPDLSSINFKNSFSNWSQNERYITKENFILFFKNWFLNKNDPILFFRQVFYSLNYNSKLIPKKDKNINEENDQFLSTNYFVSNDQEFIKHMNCYLQEALWSRSTTESKEDCDDLIGQLNKLMLPSMDLINGLLKSTKQQFMMALTEVEFFKVLSVFDSLLFNEHLTNKLVELDKQFLSFRNSMWFENALDLETLKLVFKQFKKFDTLKSNFMKEYDGLKGIRFFERVLKSVFAIKSISEFANLEDSIRTNLFFVLDRRGKKERNGQVEQKDNSKDSNWTKRNQLYEEITKNKGIGLISQSFLKVELFMRLESDDFLIVLITFLCKKLVFLITECEPTTAGKIEIVTSVMSGVIYAFRIKEKDLSVIIQSDCFRKCIVSGMTNPKYVIRQLFEQFYHILNDSMTEVKSKIELFNVLTSVLTEEKHQEYLNTMDVAMGVISELSFIKKTSQKLSQQISNEINFSHIFDQFKMKLISLKTLPLTESNSRENNLFSYMALMIQIAALESSVLINLKFDEKKELIQYIFENCLFKVSNLRLSSSDVFCKTKLSRKKAYELLFLILKDCFELQTHFLQNYFIEFVENLPCLDDIKDSEIYTNVRSSSEYMGIKNLGCICYMISIIQQFYCIPIFRKGIIVADDKNEYNKKVFKGFEFDDNLLHQLQNMFLRLEKSHKSFFDPTMFCLCFKDAEDRSLDISIQQDADEFIKVFLDKIENLICKTKMSGLIESIFGGQMCNIIECKGCRFKKFNCENFSNLSLEVKGMKNIQQSLEKMIEVETVSDYFCENCKEKNDVFKKSMIKSLPNILIFSLKRMCFDMESLTNIKIHSKYEFPFDLSLKNYFFLNQERTNLNKEKSKEAYCEIKDGDFEYKLKGVVIHKGNAEYGHYTSLINTKRREGKETEIEENVWIEFDDHNVNEFDMRFFETECFGVDECVEINNSKSAYILFYEKKLKKELHFDKFENLENLSDEFVRPSDYKIEKNAVVIPFENLKQEITEDKFQHIETENTEFELYRMLNDNDFICFVDYFIENIGDILKNEIMKRKVSVFNTQNQSKLVNWIRCVIKMNFVLFEKIKVPFSQNDRKEPFFKLNQNVLKWIKAEGGFEDQESWESHQFLNCLFFEYFHCFEMFYQRILNWILTNGSIKATLFVSDFVIFVITSVTEYMEIDSFSTIKDYSDENLFHAVEKLQYFFEEIFQKVFLKESKNPDCISQFWIFYRFLNKLVEQNKPYLEKFISESNFESMIVEFLDCKSVSNLEDQFGFSSYFGLLSMRIKHKDDVANSQDDYGKQDCKKIKEAILRRMFMEKYSNPTYDILSRGIANICTNEFSMSLLIISECLENISPQQIESLCRQMCIIKEVAQINDRFKSLRIKSILGVPTFKFKRDNKSNVNSILVVEKNLKSQMVSYLSIYNNIQGVLDLICMHSEACKVISVSLINLVLDLMIEHDEISKYLNEIKQPNCVSTSLLDWIEEFLKSENMSEDLKRFVCEVNHEEFFFSELERKIQKAINMFIENDQMGNDCFRSSIHQNDAHYENRASLTGHETIDLTSLQKLNKKEDFLIGKITNSMNLLKRTVCSVKTGDINLSITDYRCAICQSYPNGETNEAFPKSILLKNTLIDSNSIKNENIKLFFGIGSYPNFYYDEINFDEYSNLNDGLKSTNEFSLLEKNCLIGLKIENTSQSEFLIKIEVFGEGKLDFEKEEFYCLQKPKGLNSWERIFSLNQINQSFSGCKIIVSTIEIKEFGLIQIEEDCFQKQFEFTFD
jgi:hypothetical protein